MSALAPDLSQLRGNLARVRDRIADACARAGRDPGEVALVAVTKYAGVRYARALLEVGQVDLGENRVDHLLDLAQQIDDPRVRWHMIGHLQRNKAKRVARHLHVLHSLDSLALARKLNDLRGDDLPPLETYVQVRLADAAGRSGLDAADLPSFLSEVTSLTRLRIVGLMGLAPLGDPEDARPHFRGLRELALGIGRSSLALSMGMTADLEVAIEEGATVVRVGRALLAGLSEEALRE